MLFLNRRYGILLAALGGLFLTQGAFAAQATVILKNEEFRRLPNPEKVDGRLYGADDYADCEYAKSVYLERLAPLLANKALRGFHVDASCSKTSRLAPTAASLDAQERAKSMGMVVPPVEMGGEEISTLVISVLIDGIEKIRGQKILGQPSNIADEMTCRSKIEQLKDFNSEEKGKVIEFGGSCAQGTGSGWIFTPSVEIKGPTLSQALQALQKLNTRAILNPPRLSDRREAVGREPAGVHDRISFEPIGSSARIPQVGEIRD